MLESVRELVSNLEDLTCLGKAVAGILHHGMLDTKAFARARKGTLHHNRSTAVSCGVGPGCVTHIDLRRCRSLFKWVIPIK